MSISRSDYVKIQTILEAIEASEGAMIPYGTGKKMAEVHTELQALLDREEIV